jgi:hypothetical protein
MSTLRIKVYGADDEFDDFVQHIDQRYIVLQVSRLLGEDDEHHKFLNALPLSIAEKSLDGLIQFKQYRPAGSAYFEEAE